LLGSVDAQISLGKGPFGLERIGYLRIQAKEPGASLATPEGLTLAVSGINARSGRRPNGDAYSGKREWSNPESGVILLRGSNGDFRQVKVPQGLADIVTLSPAKYEI
jgi:hypothetical protein